jgi:excisionase family DNA binding protein
MTATEHKSLRLLTVREVAHRLGVSPHTLYRALADGHLPGVRLGERPSAPIRIYEADLQHYLRPTRELA